MLCAGKVDDVGKGGDDASDVTDSGVELVSADEEREVDREVGVLRVRPYVFWSFCSSTEVKGAKTGTADLTSGCSWLNWPSTSL